MNQDKSFVLGHHRIGEPDDIDSLYIKGESLVILERFDEAIAVLHEVTRLDTDYPDVWGLKAEVFSKLGDEKMSALCSARA